MLNIIYSEMKMTFFYFVFLALFLICRFFFSLLFINLKLNYFFDRKTHSKRTTVKQKRKNETQMKEKFKDLQEPTFISMTQTQVEQYNQNENRTEQTMCFIDVSNPFSIYFCDFFIHFHVVSV